jgi:uncharacterized protein (TIGR03435 family)
MNPWLPPAVMNHVWQSTLCVLLVGLATITLRSNRARVRCWLWAAASIDLISGDLDRIVIDRTGFTAPFNLLLDFAPPNRQESRLPPYSGPTIFEALEEQLGLALQSTTTSVDVFVIDHVERPSEN